MSREENDAFEASQARTQALNEQLESLRARCAAVELRRQYLGAHERRLRRQRNLVRRKLDRRAGSGVAAMAGLCAGAILARLTWEARLEFQAELRITLGIAALLVSAALFTSRTHWFRLGVTR